MTSEQIMERVTTVVCRQLAVDKEKVRKETSFVADLGADSLDTVELLMSLEEEFGVKIPDGDAEKLATVETAVDYIRTRLVKTAN